MILQLLFQILKDLVVKRMQSMRDAKELKKKYKFKLSLLRAFRFSDLINLTMHNKKTKGSLLRFKKEMQLFQLNDLK